MSVNSNIAIVILNWNGLHFLQQFLPTVNKYSGDAQIIVADNCSTDDSIQWLRTNYPAVRLIEMDQNRGFAGGYNTALKLVETDYYVLLNSDVEVTENWIQPIVNLMESDSSIAACQPKILSYHRRNFFEHAGASGGFIDYLGYPFCRGRIYNYVEEDKGQYDNRIEVFWATGACMFVRASVFKLLNGFDEDFFAHMEEIDLCWRMRYAGYKIMVEPASVMYHVGGGTLPKSNPRKTYYNFRNNLMMIHKNLPSDKLWWVLFLRLLLDGLAGIKFLAGGHVRDCLSIIKAHFYFYNNYSHRKKIRLKEMQNIKNMNVRGIYLKSIVTSYYISGKKCFSQLSEKFS